MAKLINGLLGNSKKKVGNLVTYVLKGQQVARSKAANIANPRTDKQMSQRVKMANLVNFYRANKFWMDKLAFANKKQRWSVWNAFVHANIGTSDVYLTKTEASAGAAVVAPYIVSGGSLNPVNITAGNVDGKWYTDLYLGVSYDPSGQTIGQFSQALIENNNGIERGMQLSLVECFQNMQNGVPKITTRAYEVILDPDNTALLSTQMGSANFNVEQYTGVQLVSYDITATGDVVGFAFILSRTTASGTEVSPATMVLSSNSTYDEYKSAGQLASAIASYGSGESVPFLDSTVQEASSAGDVVIPLQVLNVAGVAPEAYYGAVNAHNVSITGFSESTMVVNFNKDITDANITSVLINGNSASTTQKDGNKLYINTSTLGSGQSSILQSLWIEVNSTTLQLTFAATDDGVTE